ncbi:MAG: hypothetical protein WC239_12205, partial [Sphaerochaetaceae bacterium]
RGATVTVEHSTTLVTAAPGGVLQRAIQITPGTGVCTTIAATYTGAATPRKAGFLSAVSGISNLFDYLAI